MRIYEMQSGYGIVLSQIQNYYPVEEDKGIWRWGFKYISGVFEFFSYRYEIEAVKARTAFIEALKNAD